MTSKSSHWLDSIPKHWEVKRLKDVSTLNPVHNGHDLDGDVSFVPMESLRYDNIQELSIPFAEAKGGYTFFADGDVLVAKVTPCFENGNIAIAKNLKQGIGFGSSEIFTVRSNEQIYNRFLFYFMRTSDFMDKACATMCGVGGLKRISPEFMRSAQIFVPSMDEQYAIVAYLDKKIASINSCINARVKELELLKSFKQSKINEIVVRGLRNDVEYKKSGIDWLGVIPCHWEVRRIKDIFYESSEVTSVGDEDLLSVSEYYGVAKRRERMDDDEEFESRAESLEGYKVCRKGDLVSNIMLTWKRALGVSDYDGIVSPAYGVYRGIDIFPKYYHYLMRSDMYIAEFKRNSTGIIDSRLRLYSDRFFGIHTIYPPLSEQEEIAHYLDEECEKIDRKYAKIDEQIKQLQLLKRALINEVVTGKRQLA